MFFTLIGAVAAGFLGAGIVLLLRFIFKDRVPRWATPVVAGLMMLLATISSEYGWYPNAVRSLPDGVAVVATREHQAPWQPWTYLRPYTNSFVALDQDSIRINTVAPELRLVDLYVFTRWEPTQGLQMAVDCDIPARADLVEGAELAPDGRPVGVTWRDAAVDDPLIEASCG